MLSIVLVKSRGEDGHTAVDALAARSTMPPRLGLKNRMRAGTRQADQFRSAVRSDQGYNLGLRLKEEGIVNKVGGRFKLSTLIQKRMVALNTGARPLVEVRGGDKMAIVIQEIMQDKIFLDLSGKVQTREATEDIESGADGGTVDLTQPAD